MTKRKDEEADALAAILENEGWKKFSYVHYRFMDDGKKYLVSVTLDRKNTVRKTKELLATLRFHSVLLNEWSAFIWPYWREENHENGLFNGHKLNATQNLIRVDNCSLFRTNKEMPVEVENMNSFARQLNKEAKRMYETYRDLDALIEAHDLPGKGKGPAMIMYLAKGNYKRVNELLKEYGPYPPDSGGDERLGVWTYLTRNNLI
jgi:hypothetical protein